MMLRNAMDVSFYSAKQTYRTRSAHLGCNWSLNALGGAKAFAPKSAPGVDSHSLACEPKGAWFVRVKLLINGAWCLPVNRKRTPRHLKSDVELLLSLLKGRCRPGDQVLSARVDRTGQL